MKWLIDAAPRAALAAAAGILLALAAAGLIAPERAAACLDVLRHAL